MLENTMKKAIIILILYLLLFTGLFIISVYDYFNKISLIEIGLEKATTSLIIIALSGIGVIKTVWNIYSY
jgi:hypothetical protein